MKKRPRMAHFLQKKNIISLHVGVGGCSYNFNVGDFCVVLGNVIAASAGRPSCLRCSTYYLLAR